MNTLISTILLCLCIFPACKKENQAEHTLSFQPYTVTQPALQRHIRYLASDSMRGRATGTPEMQQAIQYITAQYDSAGLKPADSTYIQAFKITPRRSTSQSGQKDKLNAYNIIGMLEGTDSILKKEYIVLGAHYDHLGVSRIDSSQICNGADDNASGVAVMLEVAKKLSSRRDSLKRSILFIAFDTEEQGLLGSQHFVTNPTVPLQQIKLNVNLDMMGRIKSGDSVAVCGGDSFRDGYKILKMFQDTTAVCVYPTDKYLFASDHGPFFKLKIPVISPLPKLHGDYHSSTDDETLIDYDGALNMCNYAIDIITFMANQDSIVSTITYPNRPSDGFSIIRTPEMEKLMRFPRTKVKTK